MGFGMNKMLLGVAVAGALAMSSVANAAATLDWTSLVAAGPLPTGVTNTTKDADGDSLVKGINPSTGLPNTTAGILEVGDYIKGVYDYIRVANSGVAGFPGTTIGAGTAYSELTGVSLIKVLTKVPGSTLGTFNFTFGPDTAKFATEFGFAVPAGTISRVFDDFSQNFSLSGTIATSVASATNGAIAGNFGFTGAGGTAVAGEGWQVLGGTDNFSLLPGVDTSFTLGTANFALNRTDSAGFVGSLLLVKQPTALFGGTAEFLGSSTIQGSLGASTPWQGISQTNLQFVAAVPVPTAAWMGLSSLALMGVGYAGRKLRKTAL
ncbi:MAG: hypothetical protein WCI73_08580 [Phycisphaerae bacterium]